MRLENQQVVVFGGSSGIGLATAVRAFAEGARVLIVGTQPDKLQAAQRQIEAGRPSPEGVRWQVGDVRDESAVAAVFAALSEVDHVVNTTGGLGGAPRLQGPIADLMAPVETRVRGSILVAKHAMGRLRAGGSVTFFSGAGQDKPLPGAATALAAAAAVEVLARSLAVEAAPLRFNTVSPGIVDTPLLRSLFPAPADDAIRAWTAPFPVPRAAQADEVADAVLFLMANRYMTGETLVIDGGWRWT